MVGAGASGCIIAPQLAANGQSVLVLEAGGKTAWAFGGRDQSATFGTLDSATVFDVPGENERLRKKSQYWWSNVPWGLNGECSFAETVNVWNEVMLITCFCSKCSSFRGRCPKSGCLYVNCQ